MALRSAVVLAAALAGACSTTPTAPSGAPASTPGVYTAPASTPGAPGTPGGAPGAATPSAPPAVLSPAATEQRYFEDWFRGTPVQISAQPNHVLAVDVPLANSFDAGKPDIKPALGAVLDRVAESLRRQSGARVTVAAPADAGAPAALARARAERVRDHLVARRIAAPRIVLAAPARAGGPVQLRLSIPPAAFPAAVSQTQPSTVVPAQRVAPVAVTRP
jgi:outer membrane protein OmpA-like peptidoglycan-associated protein